MTKYEERKLYQEAADEELRKIAAAIKKARKSGRNLEIRVFEKGGTKILLVDKELFD